VPKIYFGNFKLALEFLNYLPRCQLLRYKPSGPEKDTGGNNILIDLSGKTALVCGASQGIGQATAVKMAELGARVILVARTATKLAETIKSMNRPEDHLYIDVDIGNRNQLRERLTEVQKTTGPIEILVCNTGGPKGGPLAEAGDDEFLSAFENHILGSSLLVKMLLPGMQERKYGRIVNVISTSVKAPILNLGVSNTIRGAVASWAKTLSLELAPFGVTVNNVLPGYTKTPRLDALLDGAAAKRNTTRGVIEKDWMAQVPLRRFAESDEIAAAICFLASPNAGYINGINLPVDGGRTASL
jgi:3-oxoacyl-[acyl-carrier protein] reductase